MIDLLVRCSVVAVLSMQVLLCVAGTVSDNRPLAGGVPGYQGYPSVAVNPWNPTRLVASALSAQVPLAPDDARCDMQITNPQSTNVIGTVALYGSSDGGSTWVARCAPWQPFLNSGIPNADSWYESDSSVSYDAQGAALAAYVLSNQQTVSNADDSTTRIVGSAIVVAKSINDGLDWEPATIVDSKFSVPNYVYSNTRIAVDTSAAFNGRMYVIAIRGNAVPPPGLPSTGKIAIFHSDMLAYGAWQQPNNSTSINKFFDSATAPGITVGPDGVVYAYWNAVDTQKTPWCKGDRSMLSRSIDGGYTWSDPIVLDDHQYCSYGNGTNALNPPAQFYRRGNAYVSIDIDRNPQSAFFGRMYAVTADYANPMASAANYADTDIYLRTSDNHGKTWSKRLHVNDDMSYNPCLANCITQMLPSVAVDQTDGSVNVSWYDTRGFANDVPVQETCDGMVVCYLPVQNPRTQVYYARSVDGGASMEKNILVSDGGANFFNHVPYSDELTPHWGDPVGTNPLEDPMGHANQYGDRIAIVATNRQAHPVWTDTRDFVPQIDYKTENLFEDLATATITNCASPKWSGVLSASKTINAVALAWDAIQNWGVGATSGSFEVRRWDAAEAVGPGFKVLATGLAGGSTSYIDTSTLASGMHCYRVVATNNCTGTKLTAISQISNAQCVKTP